MRKQVLELCKTLEAKIKAAYEESITVTEAEKLAGEFLHAEMVLSGEYQVASLDARMRKSGLKAVKAAVYLEGAKASDKKPSDVMLNAQVDINELVTAEQSGFDTAECEAELISNYLSVVRNGHIFFRTLAKGSFNG